MTNDTKTPRNLWCEASRRAFLLVGIAQMARFVRNRTFAKVLHLINTCGKDGVQRSTSLRFVEFYPILVVTQLSQKKLQ